MDIGKTALIGAGKTQLAVRKAMEEIKDVIVLDAHTPLDFIHNDHPFASPEEIAKQNIVMNTSSTVPMELPMHGQEKKKTKPCTYHEYVETRKASEKYEGVIESSWKCRHCNKPLN